MHTFEFEGQSYTAVDTGQHVDGKSVWNLISEEGEVLTKITVGYLGTLEDAVSAWFAGISCGWFGTL